MDTFILSLGTILYGTLIGYAFLVLPNNEQRSTFWHGGEVQFLFWVTFVIVIFDYLGFCMGVSSEISKSDINHILLIFWLLFNFACFRQMFQSAYRKDIFGWSVPITLFNFNNVFWHLHHKKGCSDIWQAITFLILGLAGIVFLAMYCALCKYGKPRKSLIQMLTSGMQKMFSFREKEQDGTSMLASQLSKLWLGIILLIYFYCSVFYDEMKWDTNIIISVIATVGMFATIFFFYARNHWSNDKDFLKRQPQASSILLVAIALILLFKCCADLYDHIQRETETETKTEQSMDGEVLSTITGHFYSDNASYISPPFFLASYHAIYSS